ncbi:hypothetical protein [Streptomyces sp. IBSBF 2435]|uniref:hypothetical protein n=1 Tax=Streptomyces sp. IBSBF 2435 TaxID=2903531 RepID=UPI002FDC3FC9
MPQHTHAPGHICAHCDGHATAHITTGGREVDGTLPTLRVTCPACKGTGIAPARRTLTTAGR